MQNKKIEIQIKRIHKNKLHFYKQLITFDLRIITKLYLLKKMKTIPQNLARRSFIAKTIGLVTLTATSNINLFGSNSSSSIKAFTVDIDSKKLLLLKNIIRTKNIGINFSQENTKCDLFLIGNINKFKLSEIKKYTLNHGIILIDCPINPSKFLDLKTICKQAGLHLASIEKWSDGVKEEKVFDKLTYYETTVDSKLIHQSINYLNILSKLTIHSGFQIIA